jgi:tetratricopeptide (TPR) repeat protein/tRNA A-37 threonylcarbamoyl transferase component Bud32
VDPTFVRTTVPSQQATAVEEAHGSRAEGRVLAPGTSIGRYAVLGRVGAGGMGIVYAAYDPELDRRVAIKLLHVDDRGPRQARLLREAQAMARLAHPNVVTVHDVGTLDDAIFVAMEFVEGGTLGSWMRAKRSREEIIAMFVHAGRGLAAAHLAGIVHRDFKPDNVLIDSNGRPRVTDFGLARATDGSEGDDPVEVDAARESGADVTPASASETSSTGHGVGFGTDLTRTGAVLGTPAYMSPEQFRGERAGPPSDQFSFCVALYEALYGERPFSSGSPAELVLAVLDGDVRAAPTGATVPSWLRRVVLRGLSTGTEDRFPSVEALLEALVSDPIARRKRRAGWAVGVGGVAALVGAAWWSGAKTERAAPLCASSGETIAATWNADRRAGLAASLTTGGGEFERETVARITAAIDERAERWAAAHRDACEATHVRAEQSGELLDLRMACLARRQGDLHALVSELETAGPDVLSRAGEILDQLPDVEACADGAHLRSLVPPPADAESQARLEDVDEWVAKSAAQGTVGKYQDALKAAREAEAAAKALDHAPTRARVAYALGDSLWLAEEPNDAVPQLELAFSEALAGRDDRLAARAATTLVDVVGGDLEQFDRAESWAAIASGVLRRRGVDPDQDAHLANSRGVLAEHAGRYEEAIAFYRTAIDSRTAAHGREDVGVANALNNVAMVYEIQTKWDEALAVHAEAMTLRQRVLGPSHPDVADSLNNMALVKRGMGNAVEARGDFERAIEIWSNANGPDSLSVASGLNNLGSTVEGLGERELALEHFERSLEIRERRLPADHALIASTLKNIGHVLPYLDRKDEAREALERALSIQRAALGEDHPYGAETMLYIGNLERDAERWGEAARWYDQATGTLQRAFPDGHAMTSQALLYWARALLGRGGQADRALARVKLEEAVALAEATAGRSHSLTGNVLNDLAHLDLETGRNAAAAEGFERSLEIRRSDTSTPPSAVANAAFGLARARWRSGDREDVQVLVELAKDRYAAAKKPESVARVTTWNDRRR